MLWFYMVLCLLAGGLLPVQAGMNARLAQSSGQALWAAGISFIVGSLFLIGLYAVMRQPWPNVGQLRDAPLWAWSGGLLGACFVTTLTLFAPKLGATTLIALVIAGQMLAALVVDHFGFVGFSEQSISLGRLGGVVLILCGVVLVRKY